jgi:mannose-6-phosphate isomerase-like protein (cupin superfamily)
MSDIKAFRPPELLLRQAACGGPYLEFLRERHLSMGIYVLPAGGVDRQLPHREDEVYIVLAGRAHLTVGPDAVEVEPGSIVYVEAGVEHRFHDITEELQVLVLFAPPETEPAT